MRNDANDELDHVPSLTPGRRDQDDFDGDPEPYARGPAPLHPAAAPARSASTGPLWALVGALTIALGGLGWWSFQQINLMEQQLVATQESFARISEEAAGRIQDISGKVVATESNVTSGSEALRLQVRQLENKVAELTRQQQAVAAQQGERDKRIEQLAADLKTQQGATGRYDDTLKGLAGEQGTLTSELAALKSEQATFKTAQADSGKLEAQVKSLAADVEALKKIGNPNQAIGRLEQDLLVLKSDLETRPAASAGNTAEFDGFRAQTTRNINTLQAQIQNLQQQIDAR
ncbi:ATPase [Phytopseudomonas dryadis]|uniref:ATPase n=1 Tax=Phytopseudomonas dryadis TaxID=2487520 RepID=A0A4Q9R7N9_9GAMM|nr:ATPase [Pseudomonas dryadis]TBU96458.1 ATPase [Pseudomonas dryadis]